MIPLREDRADRHGRYRLGMAITSLDRVRAKTHDWGANVAFCEGMGLRLAERWTRAGHCVGRRGRPALGTLPPTPR